MRRLLRASAGERGQALILSVLVISVVFIIGVITVDFGLWFSERRGAQKDADLSALAAAQELLSLTGCPNALVQTDANERGLDYAHLNGVTDDANVHRPDPADCALWTGCWADEGDTSLTMDSYPLDIEHPSRSLFGSIFNMAAPEGLGAHARACVGSVVETQGVFPVGVPITTPPGFVQTLCWADIDGDGEPEPLYGKRCDLSIYDKVSGEAQWLQLENPPLSDPPSPYCSVKGGGLPDLKAAIAQGGANTICRVAPPGYTASQCPNQPTPGVNWCVWSKTGYQINPIMDGFNMLFGSEGACDITGDGIDDFDGAVVLRSGTPETNTAFYEVTCDSPRLVTLIILDQFSAQGNPVKLIRYFASFFIEACLVNGTEYPKCDPKGSINRVNLVGRFVNILGTGPVGPPTDWSPKRIVLDQ